MWGKLLVLFQKLQACWESVYSKSPDSIRKVVEFLRLLIPVRFKASKL